MKKILKILSLILVPLLVITLIYLFFLVGTTKERDKASLKNNYIYIEGNNNVKISIKDIESCTIIDGNIKVLADEGGGEYKKEIYGREVIEGLGVVNCYIYNREDEKLLITLKDKEKILISTGNNKEIKKIYLKIKNR